MITLSARQMEQGNIQSAGSSALIGQNAFAAAQALEPSMFLFQLIAPSAKQNISTLIETGKQL